MKTEDIAETSLTSRQRALSDLWDEHVRDEFAPKDANAADPGHILQTGFAFWASKTLLSAVGIEVFTELAPGWARFYGGWSPIASRMKRGFVSFARLFNQLLMAGQLQLFSCHARVTRCFGTR